MIPQFGLLSHVSSLRLSLRHSGPVLTLSMQPAPPYPAPACGWWPRASGLLLRWELWLVTYSVWFFSPSYVSLWDSKLPTDPSVRGFPAVQKLLQHKSLLRTGLCPWLFCLTLCLLYFVLPLFEQNWLPFWVPGVLCQCSEVVLWKFFSIQMIFWYICVEKVVSQVLFLHHAGTTQVPYF